MSATFEDERGRIADCFDGQPVVVTYITTVKGAIRGNHVHHRTKQWTQVLTGRLRIANGMSESELGPGEVVLHEPGEPHAWEALEDTECLVFTRGPRSGKGYERDTVRLERPLI